MFVTSRIPSVGARAGAQGVWPPWSAAASSGVWNPPAFRDYVDMSRAAGMGDQKLLGVGIRPESAAEELVRLRDTWMRQTNPLAGPPVRFPMDSGVSRVGPGGSFQMV